MARIDAQDLAEQRVEVLRAVLRVAAGAAVARSDVQQAVRPEQQQAAVVVRVWVRHRQHGPPRRLVGAVRAPARAPELLHLLVAAAVGEVDVEAPAGRVVRRERHREQALLAPRGDLGRKVQERAADPFAAEQQHDPPALLHDEHPPPVAGRRGHVDGVAEGADALEPYSARRRCAAAAPALVDVGLGRVGATLRPSSSSPICRPTISAPINRRGTPSSSRKVRMRMWAGSRDTGRVPAL